MIGLYRFRNYFSVSRILWSSCVFMLKKESNASAVNAAIPSSHATADNFL